MGPKEYLSTAKALNGSDPNIDLLENGPDPEPTEEIPPDLDESIPPSAPPHSGPMPQRTIESRMDRVDRLLGFLKPGWSVAIMRVKPGWCRGYLERIDVLEDETIDLDYLVSTWGGEVLRLRVCDERGAYQGGADVPLYSYPPRFRGQLMRQPAGLYEIAPQAPAAIAPAQQTIDPAAMMRSMFDVLAKVRRDEIDTIREAIGNRRQGPAIGAELAAFAKTYSELRGVFGNVDAPALVEGASDENAFLGQIGKIVELWLTHKEKNAETQKDGWKTGRVLRPPLNVSPKPAPVVPVADPAATLGGPSIAAIPDPQDDFEDITPETLARDLSELEPDEAADCVARALDSWPKERREATIERFLTKLKANEDL